MDTELSIIPARTKVLYGTYAEIAAQTATLKVGDLGYASDRNVLYRWSGAALVAITISSRHGTYANIGDAANYPESSIYQADDQEKLYMILSGAWAYISKIPFQPFISLSDVIANSNDTERSTASTSYTKLKESQLKEDFNILRIKFTLKASYDYLSGAITAYGKIYKNGVAFGTERSTDDYTNGQEFSEDFTNLHKYDLIQVYCHNVNSIYPIYVSNFRFAYAMGLEIVNTAGY